MLLQKALGDTMSINPVQLKKLVNTLKLAFSKTVKEELKEVLAEEEKQAKTIGGGKGPKIFHKKLPGKKEEEKKLAKKGAVVDEKDKEEKKIDFTAKKAFYEELLKEMEKQRK